MLLNLNYPFFQRLANQKLEWDFYQLSLVLTPQKVSSCGSGNTNGCSPVLEHFPVEESTGRHTWPGGGVFFEEAKNFFSSVIWQVTD